VLAITDSLCQSKEMEGFCRTVITTEELPSRENFLRFKEAARDRGSKLSCKCFTKIGITRRVYLGNGHYNVTL
jgi:hypothetical protein